MSKEFARIYNGTVVEFINEVNDIDKEWHEDFVATLVDITNEDPKPEIGWVYADGQFSPPPPYVPSTPQEEFNMALLNGCEVHSTSTPALNAKYIARGPIWQQMTNEVIYIVSFNKFSGGLTQVEWPTVGGTVTFTDKNYFKNVVQAIGDWLTGWTMYLNGSSQTPPPDGFVTIS